MNRAEISTHICSVISDRLGIDSEKVTEASSLTDDLNLDSLDLMEFTTDLEDEFNITISDEELEDIVTIGNVVDLVERHQG